MKKLLRFLMLAVLFLPFALQAQTMYLTVADSTATNGYVPVYGNYMDDPLGCQSIYPASMLTDMIGENILSLSYYVASGSSSNWGTNKPMLVKLMIVTEEDLSEGYIDVTNATTVYDGFISAGDATVDGGFTVDFTTPFMYTGGNLLVSFQINPNDVGGYTAISWYGKNINNASRGGYGTSNYNFSVSGTIRNFLPKTTFMYGAAPTCFKVTNLAIDANQITPNSLTLTWTDELNTGATYIVYDMSDTTPIMTGTSDLTYTVTGLVANTAYTFGIQTNCGGGDIAAGYATISGRTACAAIAELPYTMGFEDADLQGTTSALLFPYCWTRINTLASGTYTYYPYAYNYGTPLNGSRHLYFSASSYGTYADTTGFVMPELDVNTYPMNANRVTFWAKVTSTTPYNVTVGTMSDPADMSTFTAVETVVVSETDYTKHSVSLAEANYNDAYVAFIVPKVSATMYIDDVTLEELPSCLEVPSVAITETTSSTITLSWTENPGNASATYSVYNGEELVESGIDGTTYTVEDLDANTQYTFAVQANCTSGDAPLTTVSGRTACTTFEITPDNLFSEGFEGTEFPPACWSKAHTAGTSTSTWIRNTTASNVHTGSASAQLQDQQSGNKNDLVTPLLNIPEANAYQVSFWINRTTAYASKTQEGVKVWVNTTPDTIGGTPLMHIRRSTTQGDITVDAAGWYQYSAAIPTSGDVYIIFEGISEYGAATYIDDISIEEAPECLPVTNLAVSGITAHGATLTWEGDADSYVIYNMADTSVYVNASSTEYTFEGLDPITSYTFGVASSCGNDESSIITKSFTTLVSCVAPSNVAVALTPGDGSVATVSWTDTLGSAWQLCLNGDTTDLYDADETSYSFDDLTPEQPYTVMVRTNCSSDGEGFSTWTNAVTFTPTDAYSITVNEGTTTNGYVPIYGFYVDDITKSQFIIPATDLTAMQFGNINKLTFYASNANVSWGVAEFDVYVTETDATTVDALVDYTTMTQVYAGSLSISNNKMEVTFTNPYVYMGGNLMIGFLQTVEGSYVSCSWYGVDATGASMGGYGTSVSQRNFLPKTTINYTPGEEPDCLPVNGLAASEITTEGATLTWNGDADSYNVYVINGTDTTFEQNVSETTATLTGLTAMTSYTYGVRAVCGTNESDIRTVTFATACAAVAIPYTESFEATSTTLGCWSVANIAANTGITTSNPYSGDNAFRFAYNTNPPQYLISPELSGTEDGLQVSFMYSIQSTSYPESFQLGYSTTTNEISAFTWGVEQTNLMNTTYEEYSEILPAGVKYVCIKYTANDMFYLYIDDVTFATPPTCLPVTNLTVDSVSETSATISWTGSAASYAVYNGENFVENVTANTYTFTGLSAASNYTFGVQAICSATDSASIVTISASTDCGIVTEYPYVQDFDAAPACWMIYDADGDGNNWYLYQGAIQSASYASTALTPDNWLISPQFAIPATGNYEVTWTATAQDQSWPAEHYGVYVSTTDHSSTANFTMLQEWTLSAGIFNPVIDLSDYAGQNIYIALRHFNCTDQFRLSIDNFVVREQAGADQVTINVGQNNPSYGSVTGAGIYTIGDSVTVSATAATGYTFSKWVDENNTLISTENPYTFVAATDLTLNAIFLSATGTTYTITVEVNDSLMGTATGGGTYPAGEQVTLTATAFTGYHFVNWTQSSSFGINEVGTETDLTITVTSDKTFIANFEADSTPVVTTYTVTLSTADATMGTVNLPGENTVVANNQFTAQATANEGYHFVAWTSNNATVSTANPYTFTVTADIALTATFEADSTPVVVCNTPTGLHYTAIENHAIAIAWDADANVNSWNIRYRMSGNGAWNNATANTNSYTISGLQGLTSYDIEVQANCGDGNVSEWCDAITVQTTNVGIVNHLENSVVLFPNPAREYVDIRIDGEFNVSSMEVYDVYGKLINNINVVDNPTRIYVSNLSNGMYFVRVTTDAGVVTKTFVKK